MSDVRDMEMERLAINLWSESRLNDPGGQGRTHETDGARVGARGIVVIERYGE